MADPLDMTVEDREAYFDQANPMHSRVMAKVAAGLETGTPADPIEQAEVEVNQPPASDMRYAFENTPVPGGHDPEIDGMVAGWMGEAGFPTWVANSLYQAGAALTELPDEDTIDRQAEDAEATLRNEWGSEFDERMDDITVLLSALPDQAIEFLERTGLGNDLTIIKTLDNYLQMAKR